MVITNFASLLVSILLLGASAQALQRQHQGRERVQRRNRLNRKDDGPVTSLAPSTPPLCR